MVTVWAVSYKDKRWPKEPIITIFSSEEEARKMQEHIFNNDTDGNIPEGPILDECCVYDSFELLLDD